MKRVLIVLILVIAVVGFAGAQEDNLDLAGFKPAFQAFAEGIANTLPMASTIGLQWSDAYIRKLPHFGIGLSMGAAMMPVTAFDAVFAGLGVSDMPSLSSILPAGTSLAAAGLPFPGYSADIRLGGIRRPLDLGFKIGFIPAKLRAKLSFVLPPGWEVDYLLVGGDLRYALIEQNRRLKPNLSVGIGYNFLRGGISMPVPLGDAGGTQILTAPDKDNPLVTKDYTITMEDPMMKFNWQSHVIDLKAQLSKRLLFIVTPYVGIGASYARSRAGGGLDTSLLMDGEALQQDTINDIKDGLAAAGKDAPDLSADGIFIETAVNGWALRGFGGLSVNIFFLKVDASIMYNLVSKSLGLNTNVRIQF